MPEISNFDKAFRQLTPALAELYSWLELFIGINGYCPTRKEICAGTGRHPSTIKYGLIALGAKGFIRRKPTGNRNIELTKRPPAGQNKSPLSPLPVRGSISPGGGLPG